MPLTTRLPSMDEFHAGLSNPVDLAARRIALGCGALVGHSVDPVGQTAAGALRMAGTLAHTSGQLVSLPAPGSLRFLPGLLRTALARAADAPGAVPAAAIELVIQDTALHDAEIESLLALSALRDLGAGIAIRGFNGRVASLLPRLPVSTVILAMPENDERGWAADTLACLNHLLALAHRHGIHTVASGVETEVQRAILSSLGCLEAEGPLFGHTAVTQDVS